MLILGDKTNDLGFDQSGHIPSLISLCCTLN